MDNPHFSWDKPSKWWISHCCVRFPEGKWCIIPILSSWAEVVWGLSAVDPLENFTPWCQDWTSSRSVGFLQTRFMWLEMPKNLTAGGCCDWTNFYNWRHFKKWRSWVLCSKIWYFYVLSMAPNVDFVIWMIAIAPKSFQISGFIALEPRWSRDTWTLLRYADMLICADSPKGRIGVILNHLSWCVLEVEVR